MAKKILRILVLVAIGISIGAIQNQSVSANATEYITFNNQPPWRRMPVVPGAKSRNSLQNTMPGGEEKPQRPSGTIGNGWWSVESNQFGYALGTTASSPVDVNGDGYADLAIGVVGSAFPTPSVSVGEVYIYQGSAGGLADTPAWILKTETPSSFGSQLTSAGDVNNDGYDDLLVTYPDYSNGQSIEGMVYLFLGSPTGVITTPVWTKESNMTYGGLDQSISSAGDVNGDGYNDVIIGYGQAGIGQLYEGVVHFFYGSSSGLGAMPDWIYEGNQTYAEAGQAVTGADFNGDGYSDVAIGAPWYDAGQSTDGRVFIFNGSPAGMNTTPDMFIISSTNSGLFGASLSRAGDVNQDGYDDLLVGERWGGTTDEGRVLAYYGSPGGLSSTPDWIVEGNQDKGEFGTYVRDAGDVDGDGFSDVIITNKYLETFLFRGSPDGLDTKQAWSFITGQPNASLVGAPAGDINKDGYDDLMLGAPGYEDGELDEGRFWVAFGSSTGPSQGPPAPLVCWQYTFGSGSNQWLIYQEGLSHPIAYGYTLMIERIEVMTRLAVGEPLTFRIAIKLNDATIASWDRPMSTDYYTFFVNTIDLPVSIQTDDRLDIYIQPLNATMDPPAGITGPNYVRLCGHPGGESDLTMKVNSPPDGAYVTDEDIFLSWNALDGALGYQVQIDDDPNFTSPIKDDIVPTPYVYLYAPLNYGKYYWHVRVRDGVGNWSPWSDTWSFILTDSYPLTVAKTGAGNGNVTSIPPGIDCGAICQESFRIGSAVTLTAQADANAVFTGWSGACYGDGPCVITMNQPQSVSANFKVKYKLYVPMITNFAGAFMLPPNKSPVPRY